jgi:hypothetical protein
LLTVVALFASCCLAAATHAQALLDEVLAADRAFASRSAEAGAQAAFLEFLAPDAVLFRPLAVIGPEWLRTHEEATGRLDWSPGGGRAACDGGTAVTLGSWTYRQDALVDTGYYLTVWRRDGGGGWTVAIDHGIDGPVGADAAGAGALPLGPATSDARSRSCPSGDDAKGLANADGKFNDAIRREGFDASLRKVIAPGGFVMRDGHLPARPTADWPLDDAAWRAPIEAVTRGTYAASGSDLGYTYGELTRRTERRGPVEPLAVFLRVWARDGRDWRVLADMTTPLPR